MEGSSENASVDSREDTSQESKLMFSEEEETLIVRMYNLIGERWSLIAGRIPGRTAKEIEKYWTSKYSSLSSSENASVDSREETSQESKLVFSEEEETLIVRMYNLIGERWPLIAGRIPGRTAKEIKKYWTSKYSSSSE